MTTPEAEGAGVSPAVLLATVFIILAASVTAGILEAGLGDEAVPSYLHSADPDQIEAYAAAVGIDPSTVEPDIGAIREISRRGIDPCPTAGTPAVPPDLAAGTPLECVPYDTTAGAGIGVTGLAILGAVIVFTSGNRLGRMMIAVASILAVGGVGTVYAARATLSDTGDLPGAAAVGLVASSSWIIVGVLIAPRMILMFPTGRFPSPRWRIVGRASWVPVVILLVAQTLHPLQIHGTVNPLPAALAIDTADSLFGMGLTLWIGVVILSFAGLLMRFWTARGEERQQLKWVAYAAGLAVIVNLAGAVGADRVLGDLWGPVQQAANFIILPGAALASILRFRLYDIDRIINRTVVYLSTTAVVTGLFALFVVVPQSLIGAAVEDGPASDVVVATATLVAAAVFNPLRRRIQSVVDRRFDRSRYDALLIAEEFRERLGAPRPSSAIGEDLVSVVQRALAPDGIGLWTPDTDRVSADPVAEEHAPDPAQQLAR